MLAAAISRRIQPVRERRIRYSKDRNKVMEILFDGSKAAQAVARETMSMVRQAMGMKY
jgi:hypothetical protein